MRPWVAVIWLLMAGLTQAHERSESTSHWTLINGDLHGVVTARTREVTRLTVPGDSYASLAQIFASHVGRSIAASVEGTACVQRQAPTLLESEPGYIRVDVRMHCGAGRSLTLAVKLFFGVAPSHHHFLYVTSGSSNREAVLSVSSPSTEVELRPSDRGNTHFPQFVAMGIEHIATGIDHLAFLLALLITARTTRQMLAIVTGFTVGHSITLSLAVLGVVQANRGAVECLIGLTIALAAAQNLIRGEREGRMAGLAAAAIAASLLLIPADLRPDMPGSLIMAIAVATGSAVWLASMGGSAGATRGANVARIGSDRSASFAHIGSDLAASGHSARAVQRSDAVRSDAVRSDAVLRVGQCGETPDPSSAPADGETSLRSGFSIPARFSMAAGFGLIHGLGFASALQDLHLPRGMLLSSLLGFNVGVEIGQLAVVIAAVALIAVAGKLLPVNQRRTEMSAGVASAALLAAGLAWFLTRAY